MSTGGDDCLYTDLIAQKKSVNLTYLGQEDKDETQQPWTSNEGLSANYISEGPKRRLFNRIEDYHINYRAAFPISLPLNFSIPVFTIGNFWKRGKYYFFLVEIFV